MTIVFEKQYLSELYEEGKCSDKHHRFQPQIVKKYQKRIDTLIAADRIEDLFVLNSLNFEALEGKSKFSIRIDYHYRLEFEVKITETEPIISVCHLLDITNHYS